VRKDRTHDSISAKPPSRRATYVGIPIYEVKLTRKERNLMDHLLPPSILSPREAAGIPRFYSGAVANRQLSKSCAPACSKGTPSQRSPRPAPESSPPWADEVRISGKKLNRRLSTFSALSYSANQTHCALCAGLLASLIQPAKCS